MDDLRASDIERDATVWHLRNAATEGRIDDDELETRVAAALSARTAGELATLTRDLPAADAAAPPDRPAPNYAPLAGNGRRRRRRSAALEARRLAIAAPDLRARP